MSSSGAILSCLVTRTSKLDFGDNDELRSEMLTGRRLRGQYESFRRQMMHVGRLLMTCDISELEKELRIIQGRRTLRLRRAAQD